jgi:hypothetical protein
MTIFWHRFISPHIFIALLLLFPRIIPAQDAPPSARAFLGVQIRPPGLSGGSWSIDGEQWLPSGSVLELPCGSYRVRFRRIPGFLAPPDWVITLDHPDRQSSLHATYDQRPPASHPFCLSLSISPEGQENYSLHALSDYAASDAFKEEEDRCLATPPPEHTSYAALLAEDVGSPYLAWDCRSHAAAMHWRLQVHIPPQAQRIRIAWRAETLFGDGDVRLLALANPLLAWNLRESGELLLDSPGDHRFLIAVHAAAVNYRDFPVSVGWNLLSLPAPPSPPWQVLLAECGIMAWAEQGRNWVIPGRIRAGPHWLFMSNEGSLRVYLNSADEAADAAARPRAADSESWHLTTLDLEGLWLGAPSAVWSWQANIYRPLGSEREAGRPYWVRFIDK